MEFLQQVRVIDPVAGTDRPMDVLLQADRVVSIGESLTSPTEAQIIDGKDLIFAPALIDLYSRCGEPGHEERETLDSMAAAAAAGGFGQVNLLPNTQPTIDNPAMVAWIKQNTKSASLQAWGAITIGTKGQQLAELTELAAAGIVGFTDGKAITDLALLRRLLEYAQPIEQPIMLWANDPTLVGAGIAREGVEALRFGLSSNPAYAETAPLSVILELVAAIRTPVHLMRISTARGVELVQAAKQRGVPVTASTTWLHLLYSTTDLANYDPNLRLEPPLGNETDRQALIAGVRSGVIDAIAIDHTAYTYEEKTVAFGEAPVGALGLELALPMLWQGLVESGQLSAIELWQALSTHPATCIQQTVSPVQPDTTGYILFDPGLSWVVAGLKSRSVNTHLLNQAIRGQVVRYFNN